MTEFIFIFRYFLFPVDQPEPYRVADQLADGGAKAGCDADEHRVQGGPGGRDYQEGRQGKEYRSRADEAGEKNTQISEAYNKPDEK